MAKTRRGVRSCANSGEQTQNGSANHTKNASKEMSAAGRVRIKKEMSLTVDLGEAAP